MDWPQGVVATKFFSNTIHIVVNTHPRHCHLYHIPADVSIDQQVQLLLVHSQQLPMISFPETVRLYSSSATIDTAGHRFAPFEAADITPVLFHFSLFQMSRKASQSIYLKGHCTSGIWTAHLLFVILITLHVFDITCFIPLYSTGPELSFFITSLLQPSCRLILLQGSFFICTTVRLRRSSCVVQNEVW